MPVGGDAIQKKLERLERWSCINLLKFNKEEYKALHLGQGKSNCHYRLGGEWIESTCVRKDLGVVVFDDLDMIWKGALAAQKANHTLGCMKRGNSRLRQVIPPQLCS